MTGFRVVLTFARLPGMTGRSFSSFPRKRESKGEGENEGGAPPQEEGDAGVCDNPKGPTTYIPQGITNVGDPLKPKPGTPEAEHVEKENDKINEFLKGTGKSTVPNIPKTPDEPGGKVFLTPSL